MRTRALLTVLLVVAPTFAHAEGVDPVTAEALFRAGRVAAEAGNYAVACPKFEESYRLDPALGTLLNLADCEENRGELARAWHHFRQLREALPPSDVRRPIAETRIRALEPRIPKLRVVLVGGVAANVTRDDIAMGTASLDSSLPIDPGRHVIAVTAAGRHMKRYEVFVGEGDDREIAVTPGEPILDAKPFRATSIVMRPRDDAPVTITTPAVDHNEERRTESIVLGGIGVASLVAGTVFGIVALSNLSSANASCVGNVCATQDAVNQFRRSQDFAVAADVTLGAGVVILGTAVILALVHHEAWKGARF